MEMAPFDITELSVSEHRYQGNHFCRGNNSQRRSRIGLIEAGQGVFRYLNEKIAVSTGDVVFIPENIFCYSEWTGTPDIHVVYLSFHMSGADAAPFRYVLQKLPVTEGETRTILQKAAALCGGDPLQRLEAYALFYHAMARCLPAMESNKKQLDKRLCQAVDYINLHWDSDFSVCEIARTCAISESKLYHLFQEQLGQTPISYRNAIKVNYAIQYLEKGELSVAEICRLTNFHSESYFRRVFLSITGTAPARFRQNRRRV